METDFFDIFDCFMCLPDDMSDPFFEELDLIDKEDTNEQKEETLHNEGSGPENGLPELSGLRDMLGKDR